jgi:hypothetical protein
LGVETGRSCESDVDRSKETGEEGGDAEDGHADLPGREFTDCGTRAELSVAAIALEISSRKRSARVAALQKRRDRLRAGLELILDQRGADMADLPGGASGILFCDYKGKEADRLVTRIDPGRGLAGRRAPWC